MKQAKVLALALALGGAMAQPSQAAVIGLDFTNPGWVSEYSLASLGFEFTANRDVKVTALGTWDMNADGFEQAQRAGLWDCSGNLLSSAYIDNGSPLEGLAGWRFTDIAPVALTQGGCYRVSSQGGEGFAFDSSGVSVASAITFGIQRWTNIGSFATDPLSYPATAGTPGEFGFFGANLKLTEIERGEQEAGPNPSVPVPGTLALLGLGLLPLGFSRRK